MGGRGHGMAPVTAMEATVRKKKKEKGEFWIPPWKI